MKVNELTSAGDRKLILEALAIGYLHFQESRMVGRTTFYIYGLTEKGRQCVLQIRYKAVGKPKSQKEKGI